MKNHFLAVVFLCLAIINIGCQKDTSPKNTPPQVNAGADTTLQLTSFSGSIRLVGSATDKEGTVVNYLWSQISGPRSAHISHPGTAVTTIDSLYAGTYQFQLMATDNEGATGVDFVTVTVIAKPVTTLTLSPNNNVSETVFENYYGGNNSTIQELPAQYWTTGGTPVESRFILKFDLSAIPKEATIVSAKLSLYAVPNPLNGNQVDAHYGSTNAIYLRRVTGNWSTSNLTWNNQPTTTTTNQIELGNTTNSKQDYVGIDVKGLIQEMVTNNNYGLMGQLKDMNLYNVQNFASSKHADAAKHPRLVVEYIN